MLASFSASDFSASRSKRCAQLALLPARDLLHHADATHGHEIARQAVTVFAGDRQVVDAELEHWVGKLARGDSHLARGERCGILRHELARALQRAPLRLR